MEQFVALIDCAGRRRARVFGTAAEAVRAMVEDLGRRLVGMAAGGLSQADKDAIVAVLEDARDALFDRGSFLCDYGGAEVRYEVLPAA